MKKYLLRNIDFKIFNVSEFVLNLSTLIGFAELRFENVRGELSL